MLDIVNLSFIYKKLKKIPEYLIIEIVIIIVLINCIFYHIYYSIYLNDKSSFKNIHNMESKKDIEQFDFLYFANTTFFSLGYDIIPQTKKAKIACMIQLLFSFILTSIMIARIIS